MEVDVSDYIIEEVLLIKYEKTTEASGILVEVFK